MSWVDEQLKKSRLDEQTVLEFKLMFALAGATLKNSAPPPDSISDLLARHSSDWRNFLNLLQEHRLLPVAYQALLTLRESPGVNSLFNAVKARWMGNTAIMLKMAAELVRLVKIFSEKGIRVIAFKGPALAMQAYGAVNMRLCSDLDLLVAPEDFENAESFLLEKGYTYLRGQVPFKRKRIRHIISSHVHLFHPATAIHVEVHFDLLHGINPPLFSFNDLWQRRTSVLIADTTIPTIPLPLHGLYLTIHGQNHCWEKLDWLYDIAAIFDSMTAEHRAAFITLARQYGKEDILMKALLLIHLLFASTVPEVVRNRISERRIRSYMELALQMILTPSDASGHLFSKKYWLKKRIPWAASVNTQEKWQYLAMHFLPCQTDIAALPLPNRLYFLYYFARPYFFIKRLYATLLKIPQ